MLFLHSDFFIRILFGIRNSGFGIQMYLSRSQVREIDRRSIEEFHIPGVVLMENASRGVAHAAVEELLSLTGRPTGKILILCGGGNNGGDGLAAARHLHNRGNTLQ